MHKDPAEASQSPWQLGLKVQIGQDPTRAQQTCASCSSHTPSHPVVMREIKASMILTDAGHFCGSLLHSRCNPIKPGPKGKQDTGISCLAHLRFLTGWTVLNGQQNLIDVGNRQG